MRSSMTSPSSNSTVRPVAVALGDDPKRADRRQRAALGAVDVVDAFTVAHLLSIAPSRKVEIPREHVTSIALLISVAIAGAATATEAAIPGATTIAIVVARIVPVQHGFLLRTSSDRAHSAPLASGLFRRVWAGAWPGCNRSLVRVGCCQVFRETIAD